jgi:hypothetical protein
VEEGGMLCCKPIFSAYSRRNRFASAQNSIAWTRHKSEQPAIVENVVDFHELFAILFDKANITVLIAAIDLYGDFHQHMILKMTILIYRLTIVIHQFPFLSPFTM